MNLQNNTLPTGCTNPCEYDINRNIVSVNGETYALVGSESTNTDVVLEFLPLEMWISDEWTEEDIIQVLVSKSIQSGFIGESEWSLSPTDEVYDHGEEEKDILRYAASHLASHLEELEVCYA